MPACLRADDSRENKAEGILALPEPAGRLGEIVRRMKRLHLAAQNGAPRSPDATQDSRT